MNPDAEALAIRQAQAGDDNAFARLVAGHQQWLRSFLWRLGGDCGAADDVAQEAFLAAWAGLHHFRTGGSFRAWLGGIAYRKWLGENRSRARRLSRQGAAHEPDEAYAPEPGARLDALRLLADLAPDVRAAVTLCLAADFSHAEAAEALSMPLGTVKSHVQRGRAKLLSQMEASHAPVR